MLDKIDGVLEKLEDIRQVITKIITLPKTISMYWSNLQEKLWSPFEMATFVVVLGLIVCMLDRKIGTKIIRYTIVFYFVYELVVAIVKGG